jgi:O-antigen/teichoic acid export membrane protein
MMSQVWRIGSRLVLTPLIIEQIGIEGYGIWALMFAIAAYINITDSSFGLAYSKLTAEYDARRDYHTLSRIVGAGITLVGAIALLGLLLLWIWRIPILRLFGVPTDSLEVAGQALVLVALCMALRMSVGCAFQILAGLQRLDLQYKISILAAAIEFFVSLVLLYRGWGLMALATGHFIGQVIGTTLAVFLCRRICPELRISPFQANGHGFYQMLSLGGRFQLVSILQLIALHGSKLAISALAGVSILGVFELAHKLLTLGAIAGSAIIAPLMPAFANLHAGQSHDRLRHLYFFGSRILSAICIPTFGFLAIFGDRLILLWTGKEYPLAAWTMQWMAIAFFTSLLTGVITSNLRGRGTVRLELHFALLSTILFFSLFGPAYWLLGYPGIIYSFVTSSLIGSIWLLTAFSRQENISLANYVQRTIVRPVILLGPVVLVTALLRELIPMHLELFEGRFGVLVDLIPWMAGFACVVLLVTWFGLLSGQEREYAVHHVLRNSDTQVEATGQ